MLESLDNLKMVNSINVRDTSQLEKLLTLNWVKLQPGGGIEMGQESRLLAS